MSSKATRNQNTLSAVMTSIMDATKVLKKKPARPVFARVLIKVVDRP